MALTITEKQHWKERIEARIDKRIKRLKHANLELITGIAEQSRTQAIAQSQLTKEFSRLATIEETESAMSREKEALLAKIHTKLIGKSDSYYAFRSRIDSRIAELQRDIEDELLIESEVGREIATLSAEKENLLDTVWLATSSRQVTELWQKVLNLLG
ncbi:MAG: hypothetical protein V4689_12910 [Verrucomicrobiota bacterium]